MNEPARSLWWHVEFRRRRWHSALIEAPDAAAAIQRCRRIFRASAYRIAGEAQQAPAGRSSPAGA